MNEVSFGEWLKRRRSALGLTQEQLARQLNCSTSALRKFESEERHPSAEIVEQLADNFNIPQEERKSFLRFARGDWQAMPGADTEESPWRARAAPRSNLPASTTSFIGREKEQTEIINHFKKNRLVTLVGAGGIGKSRLSIQTASTLLSDFPNGIWLVELAPTSDSALVPQVIVNTLGLIEQANRPPQTLLTDFLQNKRVLLILDNCEHLIQACAQLVETLLRACPALHILATSREALSIDGETLYTVPTLTTPDSQHSTVDTFTDYEAVHLFIERAQSALPSFSITPDNGPAIAQVCHHLDGIPLALELAAARVKLLRVEEIATRLDDRFRLLTSGSRTALPRHQTLQALIDWSHDLLSEPERVLLRRLSVFAGGWTLEAAEGVCAEKDEFHPPSFILHPSSVLDVLTSLVNKSLVIAEREQGQETRYRILETIRQYARGKLWEAGEGELMRQRHLAYYVDLAERAEPNLRAFDMVMWLDRLEAELDNIREGLALAMESDIEVALRLASALLWLWHIRAPRREGREWLERALSIEAAERGDQPPTISRALIRGKALNASGFLIAMGFEDWKAATRLEESMDLFRALGPAGKQGMAYALLRSAGGGFISSGGRSGNLLEQSLTLFREVGDKFGVAECLMQLVWNMEDDDYKQALNFAEEHLALRREIGDEDGIGTALVTLGRLAFAQDDYQRAMALHEKSITIFRSVGNKWAAGFSLFRYGNDYLWQGDYERATDIHEEALAVAQNRGDRFFIASSLYCLGVIAWFRGDYSRATQLITNSLAVFRDIGYHWLTASSLHALGQIALAQADEEKAAQWYEAELALGRETQLDHVIIFALEGLAKVAWMKGDYDLAAKGFEEGLKLSLKADLKPTIFHALYGLGRVAQSQSEYGAARAYHREALELQRTQNSHTFSWIFETLKTYVIAIAYPLDALAVLAAVQNQTKRAASLLSAAENLHTPIRFEMSAKERAEHDEAIAAARAALGEEAFAAAYEEGKKMTLDEAVAYALEEN